MTQSRYAVSDSSKKKPDEDMPKGRMTFGKVAKADPIYAESTGNFFSKAYGLRFAPRKKRRCEEAKINNLNPYLHGLEERTPDPDLVCVSTPILSM